MLMSRSLRIVAYLPVMIGTGPLVLGMIYVSESTPQPAIDGGPGASSARPSILLAQKEGATKQKAAGKKAAPAVEGSTKVPAADPATSQDETGLKFSRDIAPILVGNCTGCHNAERRRGKFDLTTFEKLIAGSDADKVIVPGKPDESHLVLRIRGEETPKMPQGNNNNLSDAAIAKIERWVQEGARLDAGIDRKAELKSYVPTPEQLRVAELRKMSASDRDMLVEKVGLKRWSQASPKSTPEVTASPHFLVFSTLPKDRAAALSKGLESAYSQLRSILSKPGAPALDWAEKASVFVFNGAPGFVEFVRSLENREVETGEAGTANFATPEPYVAVVDPLGGREDPSLSSSSRKSARGRKKGEDDPASIGRGVVGLVAEQMAMGVIENEGKAPEWLRLGLGAYFASGFDGRSPYVQGIRKEAADQFQRGWTSRASEALGGQLRTDETRAVGFAIVDWMTHDPQARGRFPAFVHGLLQQGGGKVDDVLQEVFGGRRQDLLQYSGQWVVSHYGRAR